MVALRKCAGFAESEEAQVKPNPALFGPSSKGLCDIARHYYVIGFVLDFGVNAYFAWVARDLWQKMLTFPGYSIRFYGGSSFAPATTTHNQMKMYDSTRGEPIQYMGDYHYACA